jgi:hypothetical protein
MEFGTTLSRADDESCEAGGDSVRCSCASLRPRRRASPTLGPHRRPSATPSRLANGAGPCRRRPLPSPRRTSSRRLPSPRSASPGAAVHQLQPPRHLAPPPRPCALSHRRSPAAAAGSRPTSVGLAPAAALLEPSGERETNRTIGREELRKEIKGRKRERKREKKKGKDKTEIRKINEIRLWSNKRKYVS